MNLKMFCYKIVYAFTPPPRLISKKELEIRQKKSADNIIMRILLR